VDFTSDEMRQWLSKNRYEYTDWKPAVFGVQTDLEMRPTKTDPQEWKPYARLTRTGAVSVWRNAHVVRSQLDPSAGLPERVGEQAETTAILKYLQFAAIFLAQIGYTGPIRFRLRMRADRVPLRIRNEYAMETLEYHGDQPLVIELDADAGDLIADPQTVAKRMSDEFCRAFGLDHAYWFKLQAPQA
jgi:hypothetical protein